MIVVGKPINGISLNGLEYLLDDEDNMMKFETREFAKYFLVNNGYDDWSDEELEDSFMFVDENDIEN